MFTRTGWFVAIITAVVLGAGVIGRYRDLVALGIALLACLVLAALLSLSRPELDVRRDVLPQRVSEGEGSAAVLSVTNRAKRRSPAIVARDRVPAGEHLVTVPPLAPGETHTTSILMPTDRRGVFSVGPLVVSHSDPLRLVQVGQGLGAETELIVHPRTVRVSPLPTGRSHELDGATQSGAPRGGIAFHSLREYVPGDDLRLIHWRSTAKVGTLMVRHTVVTNEPRLLLVLDTSSAAYERPEDFEEAVRIVASMASAGAEMRYPTQFHTTGGANGAIDPTGRGRAALFDTFAAVKVGVDDPGLVALGKLAGRREHGVSLGVVTGLPSRDRIAVVGRVAGRYEMATLVQVGDRLKHPPSGLPGAMSIAVETVEQFETRWKARVG